MLKRLWTLFKWLLVIATITLISFVVGLMVVVLPPLAWIGMVGLALALLIWVMPDIPLISPALVRRLFFIAFTAQIIFPIYFAFAVPGLPWISLRRIAWFPMVLAASLLIASSSEMRRRIASGLSGAKLISVPAIVFIAFQFLSIFTSINASESLKDFSNSVLYWYMALFVAIMCITCERDIRIMFLILTYVSLAAGILGFIEFIRHDHFIARLWPESIIAQLFEKNPDLFENITRNILRGGQFRANFIYNVSLSYGEFLAITAPICLFFAFEGSSVRDRVLGALSGFWSLAGVYASGSRGALLGSAVAVPMLIGLWIVRTIRKAPNSMVIPLAFVSFLGLLSAFVTLFFASHRFRTTFTGGEEAAGSTTARFDQWRLAVPKIQANPITGHGTGMGADVVGYAPFGNLTVDSYAISLLVETGVPSFIAFFAVIVFATYLLVRQYITEEREFSIYSGALACALVSFGIYRFVLSQRENHVLFFTVVALTIVQVGLSARQATTPEHGRLGARAPAGAPSRFAEAHRLQKG